MFRQRLERDFKGKRIAWVGDFNGHTPCEPGVLERVPKATRTFESLGCIVEEATPEFDFESVWQAAIRLRGWQQGTACSPTTAIPPKRALLKPEAIYEIETGLKQSAYDITAASVVRTAWYQAIRQFFERYDYFVFPPRRSFRSTSSSIGREAIAGQNDADLSRMDEGMSAGHDVRVPGARCPRRLQRSGTADRHSDRRARPP